MTMLLAPIKRKNADEQGEAGEPSSNSDGEPAASDGDAAAADAS